ncbi:MAG TPA: phytanoyl-CoA dioxygenase family protein [Polyangiaceae bacterium]|jgi:ectoine hydroxylase-related dioxygenase (phytanoyl-CoA dioxygenase family)|nr:phytanoyl-CoA dioxygenase family protein [Polyangiaceae bacterium]
MQTTDQTAAGAGVTTQRQGETDHEQARRFFAENGYAIFKNVVAKDKLAALRTAIIEEFERSQRSGALFAGGGRVSGHLNCFPGEQSRFAYDTLQERGIIDFAKAMLRNSPDPLYVGCNLNLPQSVTQHYHVDSAYTEEFMIVNVAVVDTDPVNGALEVAPGTQRKFYKYWRFALERPYRFGVQLTLRQGDVVVRSSNLWHRGMPNRSPAPRPMFALTLGDKRAPAPPGDPFLLNDGRITFYPNWFQPNFLGRLRERTFVAAPFTYSGYRFVRSLFGNKGYGTPTP